jgi:hypothetical protein
LQLINGSVLLLLPFNHAFEWLTFEITSATFFFVSSVSTTGSYSNTSFGGSGTCILQRRLEAQRYGSTISLYPTDETNDYTECTSTASVCLPQYCPPWSMNISSDNSTLYIWDCIIITLIIREEKLKWY